MKFGIKKNDYPVYIFYFIISLCKGIDLTKDNKIYLYLYIFGMLMLAIRVYKQKYNLKQIICIVFSLIVGVLVWLVGHNSSPLFLMIAIFSLKDINIKSILKMIFYIHFICFLTMIFLSSTGIIANNYIYHERYQIGFTKRYCFGYLHPNLAQTHLLSITILFYYLYNEKLNFFSHLFWIILNFIIFNFTFSRTSFYLSIIFIVMNIFLKKKLRLKKAISFVSKYSFLFLFCFTIYLAISYKNSNFTNFVDELLTGRIYYLNYVIKRFSIPIIGRINYGQNIAIDNSYFGLLYQGGILLTILILILNYITVEYLYKNKNYNELISILFLNLLCFTEDLYFVPAINFSMLFSGAIFFLITTTNRKVVKK